MLDPLVFEKNISTVSECLPPCMQHKWPSDDILVASKYFSSNCVALIESEKNFFSSQISCMSTVENNWFCCVSSRDCDSNLIKGLVNIFKNQIHMLLETIVNLVDSNVSFVAIV